MIKLKKKQNIDLCKKKEKRTLFGRNGVEIFRVEFR